LGSAIGIEPLFANFTNFRLPEQRIACHAALAATSSFMNDEIVSSMERVLELALVSDPSLRSDLCMCIANIVRKGDKEKMNVRIVPALTILTNQVEDPACAEAFMQGWMALSRNKRFAEAMLPNKIDFNRLFFEVDFQSSAPDIRTAALNIILNLLPDVHLPDGFWLKNGCAVSGSGDFALEIQEFALKVLFAKAGKENLVLAVIASTLLVSPFDPSVDFLVALAGLAQTSDLLPFVLLVVKNLRDPTSILRSGILHVLRESQPRDEKIQEWYSVNLRELLYVIGPRIQDDDLEQPEFKSLDDLCDFVLENELTPFQFRTSGILESARRFLEEAETVSPERLLAIGKIIDLCHGVLKYLPSAAVPDAVAKFTPETLLGKSISANIKAPEEEIKDISISCDLDFCAIEAWYNSRKDRVSKEALIKAWQESAFKDVIIFPELGGNAHTLLGLYRRSLDLAGNVRYHFRLNGQDFSAFDSLFHAVVRVLDEPGKFTELKEIELVEGDCPRAGICPPMVADPVYVDVLELLKAVRRCFPELEVGSAELTKQIFQQLASPIMTIGFHSTPSRIFWHFPFLFDFEARRSFFKIIAFDLDSALPFMHNRFSNVPLRRRSGGGPLIVKCRVRRSHLFEDGVKIIQFAGPGTLRIDAVFDGEEGVGAGVTQEFFTEFSCELCKKCHHLWRDDNPSEGSDSAWSQHGLFPRPDAPPEMFFIIGLLCGKALMMDMLISMPLSNAFWKLVIGQEISVAEVDEALASSLEYPTFDAFAGLPFVYPGLPDLELVEGGASMEVTEDNLEQYIDLIRRKTISMPAIVEQFRNGFSRVIPYEALKSFEPWQIGWLIEGEGISISQSDLSEHVEVSHGYTEESPQVKMLFETILEMSQQQLQLLIKFITGCDKLPVGGLKSLRPKLTIAHRMPNSEGQSPDETLPSVMTCTNYFKIPEYSSKAILREKLLIAISDGQKSFMLS
jgi:hypothetical protein